MTSPTSFEMSSHLSGGVLETGLLVKVELFLAWTLKSQCITKKRVKRLETRKCQGFWALPNLVLWTWAARLLFPDRRWAGLSLGSVPSHKKRPEVLTPSNCPDPPPMKFKASSPPIDAQNVQAALSYPFLPSFITSSQIDYQGFGGRL